MKITKEKFLTYLLVCLTMILCTEVQAANPTKSNIPYGEGIDNGPKSNYRQLLDVYQTTSNEPAPVFIWAHQNVPFGKQGFKNVPDVFDELLKNGISVISWESVVRVTTKEEVFTMWDDAKKVLEWVEENASLYNLDTNKIIIGGHSRGSYASWELAHSKEPGIKGIYYADAVVDITATVDGYNGKNTVGDFITVNSPPICFAFGFTEENLPKDNNHNPKYGVAVVEVYEKLGIKEKATCIQGIGFKKRYNYLLDFVNEVLK
ncbi:MAG: hypothetical protein ACP5DQ_12370 [Bacteroidales bacterium]